MKCIGATLTVVSFAAVVGLVTERPLFSRLRESALRDIPNNGCERDYAYYLSSNREKNQSYSSTVSYLKNIIPRPFTTKSKLELCRTSNRPEPKIYCYLE